MFFQPESRKNLRENSHFLKVALPLFPRPGLSKSDPPLAIIHEAYCLRYGPKQLTVSESF